MAEDKIIEHPIKITGVEVKETKVGDKIIVQDGKEKYEFWQTKQDGSKTKAFEQWETLGFGVGQRVEVGFKENPESFTNKEGKEINFVRRTILYFKTDEKGTPYASDAPQDDLTKRLDNLETRVTALEDDKEPKVDVDDDLPF